MKKIIIAVITFIIIIAISVICIKPRWVKEFKDLVANTMCKIEIKTSKQYKDLKNADKTKTYYKSEKEINIPILLYHKIPIKKGQRENYYMETESKKFEKQITGLRDLGYTFITYEDVIKYNNNELALPEYVVLITFDDGYLDVYQNAYPIIKKYNIPVSMFVIDNCVGAERIF